MKDGGIPSEPSPPPPHGDQCVSHVADKRGEDGWQWITFNNLLGTCVVHLLLGAVGGKHPVERVGSPLLRPRENRVSYRPQATSA